MGFDRGGRRRIEREAVRTEQLIAELQAAAGAGRALAEQLAAARVALRAACSRGQEHGGAARAPALALMALACERVLGERPSRLQLMAALGMHQGYAVQIGFSAGKPLAVALTAILHAWSGRPCHVVGSSDFLAARDAEALAGLYQACACSVASIGQGSAPDSLEQRYSADVLYATGRQLLSDFMRDHMLLDGAVSPLRRQLWTQRMAPGARRPVTRASSVAIIDDVEQVLVDDAVSPVLISAAGNYSVLDDATQAARVVAGGLQPGRDYQLDWQPLLAVRFTAHGEQQLAQLAAGLPVYWQQPKRCADLLSLAILARDALQRERHYVVQDGRIMVVDQNIHRLLAGRAWHFGVLQAVEAREGLALTVPPRTIARTAFQSFFPRYHRLAGAACTLAGLEHELWSVYRLPVLPLQLPTAARRPAVSYGFTEWQAKLAAFGDTLERLHRERRPVLAGAPRMADAAAICQMLARRGIEFCLVDGRDPAADARMLADAAGSARVTLITGGAGRGVQIAGGAGAAGHPGLQALLFEHWESHRSDMAFFARAGHGIAFASLEDEVLTGNVPPWAGLLHRLSRFPAVRGHAVRLMLGLVQWQAGRQGARYRKALVQREMQLDQQLAFSKKG